MTIQDALWQDPNRANGAVCFRNTSVPVRIFFDHVREGKLEEFLQGNPEISREQADTVLAASNRTEQRLIESPEALLNRSPK